MGKSHKLARDYKRIVWVLRQTGIGAKNIFAGELSGLVLGLTAALSGSLHEPAQELGLPASENCGALAGCCAGVDGVGASPLPSCG